MYALIKIVHISSVVLSFGLFFLRGIWMFNAPQRMRARWVRVLPHVIDTVLLVSAVTMVIMSRQYPGAESWLTAKIVALLVYIGLGLVAFRFGRDQRVRRIAWASALLVFAYIVGVALTRSPQW